MINAMEQGLKEFPVTPMALREKGEPTYLFFQSAKARGGKVCKECGRLFTSTEGEKKFFLSKDLELPKRCSSCRRKRKERNLSNGVYTVPKARISRSILAEKLVESGLVVVK